MENDLEQKFKGNSRFRIEGPRKHIIAFIISIVLTAISFATVTAGGVNGSFIFIFLIIMAIIQVGLQMAYWMHMKDKGHFIPIVFMIFGSFVVLTCVVMASFWVWW